MLETAGWLYLFDPCGCTLGSGNGSGSPGQRDSEGLRVLTLDCEEGFPALERESHSKSLTKDTREKQWPSHFSPTTTPARLCSFLPLPSILSL